MTGGFLLLHGAACLALLHDDSTDGAAIDDHFTTMHGGTTRQREGVGDIKDLARGLLEDLIHLHRREIAHDLKAALDMRERQVDAGLGKLSDETEGRSRGWGHGVKCSGIEDGLNGLELSRGERGARTLANEQEIVVQGRDLPGLRRLCG